MEETPKRQVFIDVSNITGTVIEVLGFRIDWYKLLTHLKSKRWSCENVFFYKGDKGTKKTAKDFKKLEEAGYIIRTKRTHIQRDRQKEHVFHCEDCNRDIPVTLTTPGTRKSNCDVELTVDALDFATEGTEILIMSGDGDFAYLIEKLITKGVSVRIISNTGYDKRGRKTFSSRLKNILEREEANGLKRVTFIDINDWKVKIQKDSSDKRKPPSSVAASELQI